MSPPESTTLERRLAPVARLGVGLALLASAWSLAGWWIDFSRLRATRDGIAGLDPASGALLLLAAIVLLLRSWEPESRGRRWTAHVLAFLVLEVALLRLQELATGWNAGFDRTLWPADWMRHTARMVPLGGAAFLLQGFALMTMDRGSARGWWASQLASCLAFGIALDALAVHAFAAAGAPATTGRMALPQAAAHALLALTALAARPRGGLTGPALDESPAGRALRHALPLALLLPFGFGWLRLLGLEAGVLHPAQGVALAVAVDTLLAASLLWFATRARIRQEEDRRAVENDLAQSRRRFEFAVDSAAIGTWEWELAGDVVRANRTQHELWGLSAEQPLSMAEYLERVHEEDAARVRQALAASREQGSDFRQEFRVVLPDGNVRVLGARARALREADGRAVAMHGVSWDTTAEHDAARLIEREWKREIEQREAFLSHVSQELRSPLTAVIEFVSMLRAGTVGTLTREQADYVEIASRNAASLKTMIDDLLEATRAHAGKLEVHCRRVAIHPLVSETLASLQGRASRKGVALQLDSRFMVNDVQADPQRVAQVIVHFVDNAIRFTPRGGTIRVSAESSNDRSSVVLSVADTGCGIAPEHRDHVFDGLPPSDRATPDTPHGLGVGLSICRRLAQLMGGRVWLESALGQGSTFHVELPAWSRRPALARLAGRCAPGEPLVIISAEVSSPDGQPLGMGTEPAQLECYRVVGTCVLPDKDVLMPREGPADDRESFHLVARTHLEGAEVLRARVEGELAANPVLAGSGLRHRVTVVPLPPFQPEPGADLAEILEGLVAEGLAERHLQDGANAA